MKFDYNKLKKLDKIEYLLRKDRLDYHIYTLSFLNVYIMISMLILGFTLLFISAFNLDAGIMFLTKTIIVFKLFKPFMITFLIIDFLYNFYIYNQRLKLKQEMMQQ